MQNDKTHLLKYIKIDSFAWLPKKTTDDIDNFLTLCQARGYSDDTIRAYFYDFLYFFRWFKTKKTTFINITAKNLVAFIKYQNELMAATASINRRLTTIDQFYRFCFGDNIPGQSNFAHSGKNNNQFLTYDSSVGIHMIKRRSNSILKVKQVQKIIIPLEASDLAKFVRTLTTRRDIAIVYMMLFSGLRSSEVIGLKIENINQLNSTMLIFGKGKKERLIPMAPQLEYALNRYLDTERPVISKSKNVFLALKGPKRGNPLTREGLRSLFRYKRATSGVTNANPHRFRHTFARNMAATGMSLPVLQRLLGHADHRTVIRYINMSQMDLQQEFIAAIDKIEKKYGKSIL